MMSTSRNGTPYPSILGVDDSLSETVLWRPVVERPQHRVSTSGILCRLLRAFPVHSTAGRPHDLARAIGRRFVIECREITEPGAPRNIQRQGLYSPERLIVELRCAHRDSARKQSQFEEKSKHRRTP